MKKDPFKFLLIILSGLLIVSTGHAKPFYEGKIIKLIVTTKPGGGYDFYGRLMAKFMQKYLPGSTIIVKNIPGAGHIIGTNELYKAKPDGLTFGTFDRAVGISQVIGLKGVKFNFGKLSWLGSPTSEPYSFVVSKKYKNLDEVLNAEKFRMATHGIGEVAYMTGSLFFQMMNRDNLVIITGYAGGEVEMAIMRGEADGCFGSWYSRKSIVDNGYGRPVMFLADKQPAGFEDVPLIYEVVKDKKHRQTVDFLAGIHVVGRPFAGPPSIPADRLNTLREAFRKAIHDPELLSFAQKAVRPIEFVSAERAEAWAKGLLSLSPDIVNQIKKSYGIK